MRFSEEQKIKGQVARNLVVRLVVKYINFRFLIITPLTNSANVYFDITPT